MTTLLTWLKYAGHPAGLPFMLAAVAVGVVLLYTRRSAWGRAWLTLLVLGYWAMATPAVAVAMANRIAGHERIQTRDDAHGAGAIVVLGGGIATHHADGIAISDLGGTAARVIEAVRLYRSLDAPLLVLSGGNTEALAPPATEAAAMRAAVRELGVPDSRIVLDETSLTTRDEAVTIKGMLAGRHINGFVLVTSPVHMPRALATFRAVGLTPVPSVSALPVDADGWSLMPQREALLLSDSVLYEMLASLYYRAHGWLRSDRDGA